MSLSGTPSAQSPQPLSSEQYRQRLVKDGDRRFQEWHQAYQGHCQAYRQTLAHDRQHRQEQSQQLLSPEQYRQALVKDGDRRFQEWHRNFLAYQRRFLAGKT